MKVLPNTPYIGCHGCQAVGKVTEKLDEQEITYYCPACKGTGKALIARDVYAEEVKVVRGVKLPWKRLASSVDVALGRAKRVRQVLDKGEVFIPVSLIEQLSEQDVWDSQFGSAFISLSPNQGLALEQAGFAVKETRGGYHRTPYTDYLVESIYDECKRREAKK